MDDGFLLWPAMLNFHSFMVCLNNLHRSINHTYEKAKVTLDVKGNLVQILNFLDANVILNIKNGISTDVNYKDTVIIISHMTVLVQNPARKTCLIT